MNWWDTLRIELALLLAILCSEVFGQNNQGKDSSYYGADYGGDYGAGYYQPQSEDEAYITCYTCHYHVKDGEPEGMPQCDEPFDETGVPTVKCFNSAPCGKIRQTMTDGNPDDYLVTRNCIPKCKERSADDEGNFQECCTTSLCNGAGSEKTVSSVTLIMSSIVSIFLLLR